MELYILFKGEIQDEIPKRKKSTPKPRQLKQIHTRQ